jgi:hypothetical protein
MGIVGGGAAAFPVPVTVIMDPPDQLSADRRMTIVLGERRLTSAISYVLVLFMYDVETPDERTQRHLQMLRELGELGMGLARSLAERAEEPGIADQTAIDLRVAFARTARAVRQTVALETRLAQDGVKARVERDARLIAEARDRGVRRKRRVELTVERAIEAEAGGETAENLFGDLYERLEDYDLAEFGARPLGELIVRICKQIGVTPDPSLWEDEDWPIEGDPASQPSQQNSGEGHKTCGSAEVSGPDKAHPPPSPRRQI